MDEIETIILYGGYVCRSRLIIRVASSDHKPAADDIAVTVAAMEADTEQVSDEMIDVALDRAMLDDYSLYVYLSDASVE